MMPLCLCQEYMYMSADQLDHLHDMYDLFTRLGTYKLVYMTSSKTRSCNACDA